MNETEKLRNLFEDFYESIRTLNNKIDEMFFIEYEDNYKSNFIKRLESISEERNLRFDSIEAYRLFEIEINKLIEIQQEETNVFNKKNMSNVMGLLDENSDFKYENIEAIVKDMFESSEEKANEYVVNNINEIFMPKLFDLIYKQNYTLNREDISEINRILYLFIEQSLSETKKIVSSKSKQTPEYLLATMKLKELNEYININKLGEKNRISNEEERSNGERKKAAESIFKYNSTETKNSQPQSKFLDPNGIFDSPQTTESKFKVFKNAGIKSQTNDSVVNEQNPILLKYITRAKFGLTYELSNEVNMSLINNEIALSDIDKIIETSGYKEISEEEFRKNAETALAQSRKLSAENIFDAAPQTESKFKVFKNSDKELEKSNGNNNEQNLVLQNIIADVRFGLNDDYVNAIINSLQYDQISISDVDKISDALAAEFKNRLKKALTEDAEFVKPTESIFKNR